MRTNIDIDDRLMHQAMRRSGARSKKARVEPGLQLLAETRAQGSIRRLRARKGSVAVRTTIDCPIATFCPEAGHELLHRDPGFEAFEKILGLKVIRV